MDIVFLANSFTRLVFGLALTMSLVSVSLAVGGILAIILASINLAAPLVFRGPVKVYVFVFRGTPLLVQIFTFYYGAAQFRPELAAVGLWSFFRQPYWCAALALALNTAAYTSEIIRGGFLAVPPGQIEAAKALGLNRWLILWKISGPIVLRQSLPAYGNEIISMVKATSLASTITMMEITGIAYSLISQTFRVVEVFVAAGSIYLLVNFAVTRCIMLAEHLLTPHLRAARG